MASAPPRIPGLSDWRPLARGGFATVWEARQESLNRLVAVKIDQRTLDADSERRRFLREAGAAGRMSGHPGIVTVHDAGILGDNRPYLVMELCPGGSLTRWLRSETRPTERRVVEVGVRIADALAAAHSRGVLHRDVKPANILIDSYEHAGLADFGLAAMPEPGEELSQTLEAITPAYAPPEVFQQKAPTEFGDVFSLAATLYALLKGQPPRWTEGGTPSLQAAVEIQSRPIERIPGVSAPLMDLLLAGMVDEPTERPTAAAFRDQLAALLEPAAPEGSSGTAPQRRRRPLVLAGLLVALLAVVVGFAALRNSPTTQAQPPSVGTAVSAPTTPTPSIPPMPTGFVDCSAELGDVSYCPTTDECWGSIFSAFDTPTVANASSCTKMHLYQTFAAGPLDFEIRRQPQLDEYARVKRVCTSKVVNSMLDADARRTDWEIYAIPPQSDQDNYYRCIFGRGERQKPYALHKPR